MVMRRRPGVALTSRPSQVHKLSSPGWGACLEISSPFPSTLKHRAPVPWEFSIWGVATQGLTRNVYTPIAPLTAQVSLGSSLACSWFSTVFRVTRGKVSPLLLGWFIHIYWTPASCTSDSLRSRYLSVVKKADQQHDTVLSGRRSECWERVNGFPDEVTPQRQAIMDLLWVFVLSTLKGRGWINLWVSFRHVGYWFL